MMVINTCFLYILDRTSHWELYDMEKEKPGDQGTRLLKAVEAIAISPQDVDQVVAKYIDQANRRNSSASQEVIKDAVAKAIIKRYAKLSSISGGSTALTGVVPGVGTAIAMVGGGMADATVCMKFQVDMTMCLAKLYGWDLKNEDAKHISYMIALGGSLEKAGKEAGVNIASKAGVKMLRMYLRGSVLKVIKEMFKKVGINFTRKAAEKAIPFGVGVVIGGATNYALTQYVGRSAKKWFEIDGAMGTGRFDDDEVQSEAV